MAILIPSISKCVSRLTSGVTRVAQRLEGKLDDGYLLWYAIPMGLKKAYSDSCMIHPRGIILILNSNTELRLSASGQSNILRGITK